jgi:isochorismate hydrolase
MGKAYLMVDKMNEVIMDTMNKTSVNTTEAKTGKKILVIVDMQNDFINGVLSNEVTASVLPKIIKKLQNHTIKNIDDITDVAVKNYIDQNLGEFVELFGKSITKDLMDNLLERKLGKDSVEAIVGSIAKSKNAHTLLILQ